ncbi:MAG: DUF4350 domain-containing protein, partial [Cytophagales bacterium]|nr:DUF4350 domain-containing protein [Cytophagales bacterium]
IGLVVVVEALAPQPLDWTPTYALDDSKPFGSKVLYELLGNLFPGQPVRASYQTLYEERESLRQGNYLFIGDAFDPGEEDLELLLERVAGGSTAFVAAGRLGEALEDTLNISTRSYFSFSDTVSANLAEAALREKEPFQFRKITALYGFHAPDTARKATYQTLGTNQQDEPNFVRIPWGKGWFYLHCMPQVYTNYNMLAGRNIAYIERTLSYLPVQPVYWDEFYKGNVRDLQSPLRFLIVTPSLRWAMYLALAALLLFMAFEAKRRQRVIPVIRPLANTTLEFTQTIGQLYYQHRDHKNIAEKKITYFLDHLRSHYYVQTQEFNDELFDRLHAKTGQPLTDITALFNLIAHVRRQPVVSEAQLLQLHRSIQKFASGH